MNWRSKVRDIIRRYVTFFILILLFNTASVFGYTETSGNKEISWLINQRGGSGLVASYQDGTGYGQLDDEALAVMAFTRAGLYGYAKDILNFLKNTQNLGEGILKGSLPSGFDVERGLVVNNDYLSAGQNARALLAISYYTAISGDATFLGMAEGIANWLLGLQDLGPQSPAYGSIRKGVEYAKLLGFAGAKDNADCYAALINFGRLTKNTYYHNMAAKIYNWLAGKMWAGNAETTPIAHFWAGYNYESAKIDRAYNTDCDSGGVLALGSRGPKGERFLDSLYFLLNVTRTQQDYNSSITKVDGFDWDNILDTVWFAGTEGMTAGYSHILDNANADYFHRQTNRVQDTDGGLPYSTPGPDNLGRENIHKSVAATVWYYFNEVKLNPLQAQKHNLRLEEVEAWLKETQFLVTDRQDPAYAGFPQPPLGGAFHIYYAYPAYVFSEYIKTSATAKFAEALIKAYHRSGHPEYLERATLAAQYLLDVSTDAPLNTRMITLPAAGYKFENGRWAVLSQELYVEDALSAAQALLLIYQETQNEQLRLKAEEYLDAVAYLQTDSGAIPYLIYLNPLSLQYAQKPYYPLYLIKHVRAFTSGQYFISQYKGYREAREDFENWIVNILQTGKGVSANGYLYEFMDANGSGVNYDDYYFYSNGLAYAKDNPFSLDLALYTIIGLFDTRREDATLMAEEFLNKISDLMKSGHHFSDAYNLDGAPQEVINYSGAILLPEWYIPAGKALYLRAKIAEGRMSEEELKIIREELMREALYGFNDADVDYAWPGSENRRDIVVESNASLEAYLALVPNHPPQLSPIGNKSVYEGGYLTFRLSAKDIDGDRLSFSAVNLPKGAVLNAGTGVFSYRPFFLDAGSYQVTFRVSDGSATVSQTVTITVINKAPPPQKPLIIVKTDKASYPQNEPVTIKVYAQNTTAAKMKLAFNSALKVDYIIDTGYRWSEGKVFAAQVNYVDIPAGQTVLLAQFTHQPAAFFLGAGKHLLRAEVVGYNYKEANLEVGL